MSYIFCLFSSFLLSEVPLLRVVDGFRDQTRMQESSPGGGSRFSCAYCSQRWLTGPTRGISAGLFRRGMLRAAGTSKGRALSCGLSCLLLKPSGEHAVMAHCAPGDALLLSDIKLLKWRDVIKAKYNKANNQSVICLYLSPK